MKRIAYEVLGNEETRNTYDRLGEEGLKQQQRQQQNTGNNPFGDIFSQFFGGNRKLGYILKPLLKTLIILRT